NPILLGVCTFCLKWRTMFGKWNRPRNAHNHTGCRAVWHLCGGSDRKNASPRACANGRVSLHLAVHLAAAMRHMGGTKTPDKD
ncbi:hypothetical protein, partial [Yoonia sp.]|uniref:hypothetical protein n=1 Tax=Yoonia sp. TaxID=2212373 RepID=UPI0035C85384